MKLASGIRLLDEVSGTGPLARKGDRVTYNLRLFLNRGDEIPLDELQREHVSSDRIRVDGGRMYLTPPPPRP